MQARTPSFSFLFFLFFFFVLLVFSQNSQFSLFLFVLAEWESGVGCVFGFYFICLLLQLSMHIKCTSPHNTIHCPCLSLLVFNLHLKTICFPSFLAKLGRLFNLLGKPHLASSRSQVCLQLDGYLFPSLVWSTIVGLVLTSLITSLALIKF